MLVNKGEVVAANSSVPRRELLKSELRTTNKSFSLVDYVFSKSKVTVVIPPLHISSKLR